MFGNGFLQLNIAEYFESTVHGPNLSHVPLGLFAEYQTLLLVARQQSWLANVVQWCTVVLIQNQRHKGFMQEERVHDRAHRVIPDEVRGRNVEFHFLF